MAEGWEQQAAQVLRVLQEVLVLRVPVLLELRVHREVLALAGMVLFGKGLGT